MTNGVGGAPRREFFAGALRLPTPLVMAPMAGLTNIAFRRLLAELGGAGLCYTEMLSARALRNEKPGRSAYLSLAEPGRPLCAQIFASRPAEIPPAVEKGQAWAPDAWDLNMGCPAPAVVKQGAGSALLEDLGRAREMAAAMRKAVTGPLLFKLRALPDAEKFRDLITMLADEGADALVIHARYPREKLGRPARLALVRFAAAATAVPVVGNGDVREADGAVGMMRKTGCAAVMIGRGAVERPWLFREAAARLGLKPPPLRWKSKSAVFGRMAVLLRESYGPPADLPRLRLFAKYFAANYKYGHEFWKQVNAAATVGEAVEKALAFGGRHGKEDSLEEESLV